MYPSAGGATPPGPMSERKDRRAATIRKPKTESACTSFECHQVRQKVVNFFIRIDRQHCLVCGERVDYVDGFGVIPGPGVISARVIYKRNRKLVQIFQFSRNSLA